MKSLLTVFFALCVPALIAQEPSAQKPSLAVIHGPYLQELTTDGVTVLWVTNAPCVGRVEYGSDEPAQIAQTVRHGMIDANTTHHSVRITGLKPGQKYQYRLVNTEIVRFGAYNTTLGETILGDTYSFTTLDPVPADFSFIVTQDIHSQAEKYVSLLDKVKLDEAVFVVLNGDIDNDPREEAQLFSGHIDVSVERFAKEKPFILVTGNHETRGAFARKVFDVYPHSSGRFYYSFSHGGVYFMVLACGEDKEDNHPVYAGLNLFDEYRAEQARWIEREMQSDAAKSARYRIVFTHIPPFIDLDAAIRRRPGAEPTEAYTHPHAVAQLSKLWAPLFRKGNVDLVVSGHTHRHQWLDQNLEKGDYALFIGSNREIETIKVTDAALEIVAQDTEGDTKSYRVLRR